MTTTKYICSDKECQAKADAKYAETKPPLMPPLPQEPLPPPNPEFILPLTHKLYFKYNIHDGK